MKLLRNCIAVFALAVLIVPATVSAASASLYLSPSAQSVDVGQSVSVGVYVSSTDVAMNAASGIVSFPTDKLEMTSISSGGSIIDLFVRDPSFSNGTGTARFEGITLNPGYTGSAGNLVTMTFTATAPGTAVLSFDSGSVLANDGEGTSILSGLGTASITIGDDVAPSDEEEPPVNEQDPGPVVPRAPTVSSGTHPESEQWYSESTAEFDWLLPSGTTGVSFLIDQNAETDPGFASNGVFSSYIADGLEDGEWFFHIRLQNENGWGPVTHFPLLVDTLGPLPFDIGQIQHQDAPALVLDATDEGSGISHYLVNIGDAEEVRWEDDGSHIFTSDLLTPGQKTIAVTAVDFAGNTFTSSRILEIDENGLAALLDSETTMQSENVFAMLLAHEVCRILLFICIFLLLLCLFLLFLLIKKSSKEKTKSRPKKKRKK